MDFFLDLWNSSFMKIFSIAILFLIFSAYSKAQQPPQDPPAIPPPQTPPTASGKIPLSALTPEERKILANGEISDGAYIGGGAAGTLIGFGIGHAIQGRYGDKGWIFTLGEFGSIGLLGFALVECAFGSPNGPCTGAAASTATLATLGFAFFRIWEIVDVWITPPSINRDYQFLKDRVQTSRNDESPPISMGVIPLASGGLEFGLQYHF